MLRTCELTDRSSMRSRSCPFVPPTPPRFSRLQPGAAVDFEGNDGCWLARNNKSGASQSSYEVRRPMAEVTILAAVLTGAVLIREREHGPVEHLLVMPVTPFEIMTAKIWAGGTQGF